ncbi:unknown [Clostridium sp. CAG:1219]|nr:unknown [Clostridium sp. CAG:1219]
MYCYDIKLLIFNMLDAKKYYGIGEVFAGEKNPKQFTIELLLGEAIKKFL